MKTIDIPKGLSFYKYAEYCSDTSAYWEYRLDEDMDRSKLIVFNVTDEHPTRLWFLTNYVIPVNKGSSILCLDGDVLTSVQAADPQCRPELATIAIRRAQSAHRPIVCYTTKYYPSDPILVGGEYVLPLAEFAKRIQSQFGRYVDATERWLYGRE